MIELTQSAEYPMLSDTRKRFYDALRLGTIQDLADAMYAEAQSEVDAANAAEAEAEAEAEKGSQASANKTPTPGSSRGSDDGEDPSGSVNIAGQELEETIPVISTLSCTRKLVKDRDGDKLLLKFLLTMDRAVLAAVILNTVGYHFVQDSAFRESTLPRDNCAGIYMVTSVARGTNGRGFNRRQYSRVKDVIAAYMRGYRVKITSNSTPREIDDAELAVKIESAIKFPNQETETRKKVFAGKREFFIGRQNEQLPELLCQSLGERISEDLDPSGLVRQLQSIVYIGCSESIESRFASHDPFTKMSSSPKQLVLLFSCFKYLSISFDCIRVPLLKIWDTSQLGLAEITMIMLAGGMLQDGGLNATVGGANQYDEVHIDKHTEAINQMYIKKQWTGDDLEQLGRSVSGRMEAIAAMERFKADQDTTSSEIECLKGKLDDLEAEFDQISAENGQILVDMRTGTEKIKEETENFTQYAAVLQQANDFQNEMLRLLDEDDLGEEGGL